MSQSRSSPRQRSGPRFCERSASPRAKQPLHRLAEVRRQEGVSLRRVARSLELNVTEVRVQENADSDLRLSTLYRWQAVLNVPVSDLLVDGDAPLSTAVAQRAQLVRLMKTALSILERSERASVRRLAQTMVNQLTGIMPELESVSPWHAVGQRRTLDEYGRIVERCLPDHIVLGL